MVNHQNNLQALGYFALMVLALSLGACGKRGDPLPLPCDTENPCDGTTYPMDYPPKN